MFAVIERVLADRTSQSGRYTIPDKIVDVLNASPEPMSSREIKLVLMRLGQMHTQASITTCLGDLIDMGKIECVGKALREVRSTTTPVRLYGLVKDDGPKD